jgi:Fur family peroxide stress response transcriptional regulator
VQSPTELAATFRASGLKVTPQRQLLFRLLDGNDQHPTAEALYIRASESMPGISLRTVYGALTDLASMGEIQSISVDGGAARFDPNVDEHHHAVCDVCGAVGDVYVDAAEDVSVRGLDGFTTTCATIVFCGTCAACSSA